MKPLSSVILLVVAAGLFAFIYFYTAENPGTRASQEASQYVTAFNADDISGITISKSKSLIALQKEGDQWFIKEPINDRADSLRIHQMLSQLEMMPRHETIIPQGDKDEILNAYRSYSVCKPKMRIELSGKNTPPAILIGRDTAVHERIYLRLEDHPEVYVVDVAVRDQVNVRADSLRDPQLMATPASEISNLLISTGQGDIELEKRTNDWRLVRPINARANTEMVDHLVRSLTTTRMLTYIGDATTGLANYGLSSPRGTITLSGDEETPAETLHIGDVVQATPTPSPTAAASDAPAKAEPSEAQTIYAHYPPRNAVYTLPIALNNALAHTPNDFRDRTLASFDLDMVDRFAIARPDGRKLRFVRNEESWVLSEGDTEFRANPELVMAFLDMLRTTQVNRFVADTASDLGKYGLDTPVARITISAYSSEDVPHYGKGEHQLASLLFGKIEGEELYAQLESEPFIVSLNRSFLATINTNPTLWRSLEATAFDTGKLNGIEIQTPDRSIGFLVDRNGAWRSDRGDDMDQAPQFESFTHALSTLRAVRWVGSRRPDHGLERPEMTITYELEGNKHTLRIGANSGKNMWYAALDNEDAVFLISRPTYETLRLPLTLTK